MSNQKNNQLYSDFVDIFSCFLFPGQKRSKAKEEFLKLSPSQIASSISLIGNTHLLNAFKYHFDLYVPDLGERLAKSKALRKAFTITMAIEGNIAIGKAALADPRPVIDNKPFKSKPKTKKAKTFIKKKVKHKQTKRKNKPAWEKEKDYNLYGFFPRFVSVPM